ncbi:MAG: SDR family oxidoreductase [Isosphaeraceae bacterium]|nr:SDR family oxidoreductase [Isosphaeraceae bacterium]
MRLAGRSVLITGGRRVGRSLALMLMERGMNVAMTFKSSRAVIESTVSEAARLGASATAIEADLSAPANAEAAVDRTIEAFGRIDVLVNMASVYRRTPFMELVPGDFDEMIAANLAGPYHAAVAAGRRMLAQEPGEEGVRGKIVNVGDWAVERPYRNFLPYLVAKGGLSTLTLALAKELSPGVLVNAVLPAMVEAPEGLTEERRRAVLAETPVGRSGVASDVNNLILYLLEGTDFATGGIFRVDGGRFLGNDSPN